MLRRIQSSTLPHLVLLLFCLQLPWIGCMSGYRVSSLKDGEHTFRVRATDPVGHVTMAWDQPYWTWITGERRPAAAALHEQARSSCVVSIVRSAHQQMAVKNTTQSKPFMPHNQTVISFFLRETTNLENRILHDRGGCLVCSPHVDSTLREHCTSCKERKTKQKNTTPGRHIHIMC